MTENGSKILSVTNGKAEVIVTWSGIEQQDDVLDFLQLIARYIAEGQKFRTLYQSSKGGEVVVQSLKIL